VTKGGFDAKCWESYKASPVSTGVKGTTSGLTEYHVLEDGACIATLFDAEVAETFAANMCTHAEGHVYSVREVRP
jgi:hypothetical protein